MSVTAVVGAQWGDEGKGRVVDYLAHDAELVIRYGGGNNAGHTVVNPHGHFKLHLIPSGIFHPGTRNLLGNGVVINPPALVTELDGLAAAGFDGSNLFIADRAHLVMPYHVLIDQLEERDRGAGKLGTTSRGIGPAYVDKVARRGIRVIDLMEADAFRQRLDAGLQRARRVVEGYFGAGGPDDELREQIEAALDEERVADAYLAAGERLRPHVVDGQELVDGALAAGQRILLEGQLGTMRDIDWGIYPYVTSSSPIPGGASLGAGLPAVAIDRVLGVAKAYTTAVGAGPVPTELTDETGEHLRERGAEYGTSTGRPRRCGWYDAVAVRFSVRLAGYSAIALTKLDVLDGMERIRLATAYRDPLDGTVWNTVPASTSAYERLEPVYEELPGWQADTTGCRAWDELPEAARRYVERLEELAGVPISHLSVGPERAQMILRGAAEA
ncbi:MAG TPA: adenylosuccinate synthase [Candidatus Limnocylindria bacterium]|jgi:adenylosuccinate synthase|nr:adenylosuccinate synthase [Candidatus Limnocylindria bacterium]